MKHQLKIIALLVSSSSLFSVQTSFADGQGFYIGASAGYSALNTPSGDVFATNSSSGSGVGSTLITETSSSSDIGGFGGSLYAGYNINKTFALELDYTSYAKSKYSSTQNQYIETDDDPVSYAYQGTNTSSINYTTYSIDFFAKASVPIFAEVSGFAKLGASYVNQKVEYTNPAGLPSISVNSNDLATPDAGTNAYTAIRPSGALGLSLQATEHLSASIFAQGFLGRGNMSTDSSAIASAYLVGASLSYTL